MADLFKGLYNIWIYIQTSFKALSSFEQEVTPFNIQVLAAKQQPF